MANAIASLKVLSTSKTFHMLLRSFPAKLHISIPVGAKHLSWESKATFFIRSHVILVEVCGNSAFIRQIFTASIQAFPCKYIHMFFVIVEPSSFGLLQQHSQSAYLCQGITSQIFLYECNDENPSNKSCILIVMWITTKINQIICSLSHCQQFLKISSKSIQNLLELVCKQTGRNTDTANNISFLLEVTRDEAVGHPAKAKPYIPGNKKVICLVCIKLDQ